MEASGIIKGVSGMAGAIPIAGPIISGLGSIIGGILEGTEADAQKAQADKLRKDALKMKPAGLTPEFQQKLTAEKMAELGGLPGKFLWQNMLDQRTANDLLAIRESAPNGAAALAAASALAARNSQDLNMLGIKDAEFRNEAAKDVRNTLWDIGLQKNRQEDIRNVKQRDSLTAASALENAGTFNKQNALNKIIGSVGGTATAITSNLQAKEDNSNWMEFLKNYYGMSNQAPPATGASSGFGQFTEYSSGATLPASTNMFSPLNYPVQLGQ